MARYDLTTARNRELRALELAADGLGWDKVAERLGYRHRASAWRAAHRLLARNAGIAGERYRVQLLLELAVEQEALMPVAVAGDLGAAENVLRRMDKRERLLPLKPEPPRPATRRARSWPDAGTPAAAVRRAVDRPDFELGPFVDLVIT